MKSFPRDCTSSCPHYKCWDLSIDDWVSYCDKLQMKVDDCDSDYLNFSCPLEVNILEVKANS